MTHNGTYEFLAPECHKSGKHTKYYSGSKTDIWAMGLCIYALSFGRLPYDCRRKENIVKNVNELDIRKVLDNEEERTVSR